MFIQSLTLSPLAFTFRQRILKLLHDVTDWHHGESNSNKEQTRLYRFYRWLAGRGDQTAGQRALVSVFELIALISLVFYFIGGLVIQNI